MISSEERSVKPYALPVQCIPYVSNTHEKMRSLVNTLVKEMVGRNMSVAGEICVRVLCVDNTIPLYNYLRRICVEREYNSLRMNGNTRPLHILQIRSAVRAKMSRTNHKTLLDMEGKVVSLYS